MKAIFLFVLASVLVSLPAEASVALASPATEYSVHDAGVSTTESGLGLFKRKKYKYKKRRKSSKNRRQHRLFGR
ncbi:hypothetical protein [Hymenobacter metallicola]|uniref:Uncharacterized protein n=1 Tax=Hymenobacter metallicola TaxID=2563114 RepID=A0A4Z0Q8M4_9BACT|nr:hypothetical protein [Hymenobacter metallicola]TGE26437.1 hypothetical protein E5K02_16720 [Hymenobacter metallicola]